MRGVPLRVELGPKDVAKNSAVLARRDRPGKEGKSFVPQPGIAGAVTQLLDEIQHALFDRALQFSKINTVEPHNCEEFKQAVENEFAYSFWCGSGECEKNIKNETKATMRCIPLDQTLAGTMPAQKPATCIYCGSAAQEQAIFARAY